MALSRKPQEIVEDSKNPLLAKHESWGRVPVGEIADILNGFAFKSSKFTNDKGMPLIRIRDVGKDSSETYYDGEFDETYLVKDGDLLVGMDGDFRAAIWKGGKALLNQRVCKISLKTDEYDFGFLSYVLQPYLDAIHAETSAVTVKHLSSRSIAEIPLPLPPKEQQKRIVAKIEELFSHIDAGIEALKKAKQLLKQYRQSVLKAAVTGELTKEWREANKDKLEPASQLLERILKERGQKWEEQQLEQFKAKGIMPKNDKWKEKYNKPDVDEVAKLIELPEGWLWVSTELTAKDKDNSLGAGPFGTIFKKKDFRENGVPIIFLRHVKAGRYLTKRPTYMDQSKWEELFVPYSVFGGEILMTKLGDPPGEAAIYPRGIGPAMVTPDVIKLDVNDSIAVPEFLMNFYNSEISTSFITKLAFGTTRLRVTLPIFKALPVPIPPLDEQREIVRAITEKNDGANRLEDEIDAQLIKAEKNKQSILASAFTGKVN